MTRALRVLIDARMLIGRFAGVARVVTRLVDEFAAQDRIEVVALCGHQPYEPWAGRNDIEMILTSFKRRDRSPARRWMWETRQLASVIRRSGCDVYHATWNSGVPARCPVPCVLTVHDLIPWHERNRSIDGCLQRIAYRRSMRTSAWRASAITVVSQYSRGDILRTLGVASDKISVIPNGTEIPNMQGVDHKTGEVPYVLYVGGHEARKNLTAVFLAMNRYWEQWGPDVELRLTGKRESLCDDAALALSGVAHPDRVRFLGTPNDAELSRQYTDARLLLMLSKAEGFGLPVIEAMAHGCPVVAANRASLPEVAGDAGIIVDPDDIAGVSDAIHALVVDPHRHADLVQRGRRRAESYRWPEIARKMRDLYETVARPVAGPHASVTLQMSTP